MASSVYVECKKCTRGGSYCRVIAHLSDTNCKVQCEGCGKSKRYSLQTKKKEASPRSASAKSIGGLRTPKPKTSAYAEKINTLEKILPYSIKESFHVNVGIDHPKFGRGIVIESSTQKISVAFQDQVRELIHNRKM